MSAWTTCPACDCEVQLADDGTIPNHNYQPLCRCMASGKKLRESLREWGAAANALLAKREREVWNSAIEAAAEVISEVSRAAWTQGTAAGPASVKAIRSLLRPAEKEGGE